MMTMNDLVDLRMQQQIAHEIYRQQIMQRIPGKLIYLLIWEKIYSLLENPGHTLRRLYVFS